MSSLKIHAAALAHARRLTNDHSDEGLVPFVDAYETGWHQGFHDRPKPATFPLSGQREFLRVLGQYVAENIEIYHPATGRYGRLVGLPATYEGQGEPLADVEFYADAEAREEGGGDAHEPAGKILPVLYGFEDLATEIVLADGRRVVPAVEVAKLGGGHKNIDGAEFIRDIFGNTILSLTSYGKHMWSEWSHNFAKADIGYPLEKISWLRAAHFAVGLRPDQYHRKQAHFTPQVLAAYAAAAGSATPCDCQCDGCSLCVYPDGSLLNGEEVSRG